MSGLCMPRPALVVIRPITCVGFMLACTSGFYLYQTKHRVTVIDHEIASTVHQTGVVREQIRMLAAEWALLDRPDRIQQLADQYTTLKPSDPSQYASLEELDSRLAPQPSPDGAPVAATVPPANPPAVPATDVVAQAEPVSVEQAQVPPATGSAAAPPPEASSAPPASPASDTITPPASSQPGTIAEGQPPHQDAVAAQPVIDVAQLPPPHEAEIGKSQETAQVLPPTSPAQVPPPARLVPPASPVSQTIRPAASPPPAAPVVAQPPSQDAEAARLAAELAQLKRQHEAEAAQTRLLQQEADRLATQIAQRQKSLEMLHAQAEAAKLPLPAPAPPRPAVAAATQPSVAEAARVAAELAQLKQQHDAEAATNRRLQAEVERLATQMEQQQRFAEASRMKLPSAKPLPAAAPQPGSVSFNAVESIITRLRHEQVQPHEPPPPPPSRPQAVQPPAPAPAAPAVVAQYRPQVRPISPWAELMNARAALGAGDTYSSRERLEVAQSELLSQPSRRHYFAAAQITMAVAMINAGATIPALHFLDLAIANAGSGVPYAAEEMQPPPGYGGPVFQP